MLCSAEPPSKACLSGHDIPLSFLDRHILCACVHSHFIHRIREAVLLPKESEESLPAVGAIIKTSQSYRQTFLGCVLEVRNMVKLAKPTFSESSSRTCSLVS